MPPLVSNGAMMTCSFGVAPAPLTVIPMGPPVQASNMLAANIQAFAPMANIPTFGMCITQSNPAVAAATSAALGVPTPAPCIPATTSPWSPGAMKVTVNKQPALHSACMCNCMWGGVITITSPGNAGTVQVN